MLKAIGTSLADVAAFMHEMELHQGYPPRANDGRGIERIRQLAYKLQSEPEDQVGHSRPVGREYFEKDDPGMPRIRKKNDSLLN